MTSSRYRTHALYAVPLDRGRWFLVVGETACIRLPFNPFWESRFSYSKYTGRRRPETQELCDRYGVEVLFLVFIDNDARGSLLRKKLSEVKHGVAFSTTR